MGNAGVWQLAGNRFPAFPSVAKMALLGFQQGLHRVHPLRVFLQSGAHDADLVFGSWPLANQQMAAALKYKGYDYKFEFGDAGHNLKHGGAVFPDTMRWLWRDYPKDPTG